MPHWVQVADKPVNLQYQDVGISTDEVVELASAFRLYGFWRIDLDTGHLFASEDVCRIFGLAPQDGPMNMVALTARIHPDDMCCLMETYERASSEHLTYHNIFRVKAGVEEYKYVRTVGKFRDKPGTSGEVVGITYEFFAQRPGVTFFLDETEA